MSLAPAVGSPSNCGTFLGNSAPIKAFDKQPIASKNFRLLSRAIYRITIPSSVVNVVDLDTNLSRSFGATLITDYEIQVEYLKPSINNSIIITSSNENILPAPLNGISQAVATGTVTLKATSVSGEFSAITLSVINLGGTASDSFLSYVNGSAAKHASDAIDSRIANKNATAKAIYTTQNHSAAIYVRNTNCWAANLDLTCISPWNSTGGNQRAGTLISRKHVLFCEHYDFHPTVGSTIRFIAADNTVVNRTITAIVAHPNYGPFWPDISIGVLDSDVPNSISFAKVLPQDFQKYFPTVGSDIPFVAVPSLILDQEEKALISEWRKADPYNNSYIEPKDPQRKMFFESMIGGDSGNPAFLIINNQLVLLNVVTFGGAGTGTNLVPQKDIINAMMTNLGGGYQLTEVDLSGFMAY